MKLRPYDIGYRCAIFLLSIIIIFFPCRSAASAQTDQEANHLYQKYLQGWYDYHDCSFSATIRSWSSDYFETEDIRSEVHSLRPTEGNEIIIARTTYSLGGREDTEFLTNSREQGIRAYTFDETTKEALLLAEVEKGQRSDLPALSNFLFLEDVTLQWTDNFQFKLIGTNICSDTDDRCWVIERRRLHGTMVVDKLWLDEKMLAPRKIDTYNEWDKKRTQIRTVLFFDYKYYKGKYWRPSLMVVISLQPPGIALLTASNYSFDTGLTIGDLGLGAVKKILGSTSQVETNNNAQVNNPTAITPNRDASSLQVPDTDKARLPIWPIWFSFLIGALTFSGYSRWLFRHNDICGPRNERTPLWVKNNLGEIAKTHSQNAGVLAGLAVTTVAFLLGSGKDVNKALKSGSVAVIGIFVLSLFGYIATSMLYSITVKKNASIQYATFSIASALYYFSIVMTFCALYRLFVVANFHLLTPIAGVMLFGAVISGYFAVVIPLRDCLKIRYVHCLRLGGISFILALVFLLGTGHTFYVSHDSATLRWSLAFLMFVVAIIFIANVCILTLKNPLKLPGQLGIVTAPISVIITVTVIMAMVIWMALSTALSALNW